MAKPILKGKKSTSDDNEEQFFLEMPRPRLTKLIIKNYRCIGANPVEIDLNDIVVLVGPNNAGKSSILKAYETVMNEGSKKADLKLEDFPNGVIDSENLPQIELHTIVFEEKVGGQWITKVTEGEWLVKEKWTWEKEGAPKRQGWDVIDNNWHSSSYPFGFANIANLRRPEPHRVDAFDKPDEQAEQIKKLLIAGINDRIKSMQSQKGETKNEYHLLLDQIKNFQNKVVDESDEQVNLINNQLTSLIKQVFPGYKIDFSVRPENNWDNALLFKGSSELFMGPENGFLSSLDRQGSGARRTLLWTALKFISENNQRVREDGTPMRSHLLLIDEPEICLHPNAIREACNVLYDLPKSNNWQVMVTTHSPVFIDFSRDNTTIVRVNKDQNGVIQGTTIFRPDKAKLDINDRNNLKLLNLCDPYVAEFFFGGKIIIVEGDTEYTAFNYIKAKMLHEYKDIHIIRARGKATIVSLIKILNQFGSNYSVLHDSDSPLTKKGDKANPAWGNNPNILEAFNSKPATTKSRLLASLPNFEQAYFGLEILTDKPYNALKTIEHDATKFALVKQLFDALIDFDLALPTCCTEWSSITELEEKLKSTKLN